MSAFDIHVEHNCLAVVETPCGTGKFATRVEAAEQLLVHVEQRMEDLRRSRDRARRIIRRARLREARSEKR